MLTFKVRRSCRASGGSIYCLGRVIESGEGAYKGKRRERSVFGMIGNELQKLIEETVMALQEQASKNHLLKLWRNIRPGCALNLRRGA